MAHTSRAFYDPARITVEKRYEDAMVVGDTLSLPMTLFAPRLAEEASTQVPTPRQMQSLTAAQAIFFACGAWMVGLGLYFVFVRPALLPEDLRYFDMTVEEVEAAIPQLLPWLRHVFAVMGGYMFAAGILAAFIAARLFQEPLMPVALALAGISLVLMSVVNFAINSDYRWLLLLPSLFWITGIATLLFNRLAHRFSVPG
jgi:hypothetical protein